MGALPPGWEHAKYYSEFLVMGNDRRSRFVLGGGIQLAELPSLQRTDNLAGLKVGGLIWEINSQEKL